MKKKHTVDKNDPVCFTREMVSDASVGSLRPRSKKSDVVDSITLVTPVVLLPDSV